MGTRLEQLMLHKSYRVVETEQAFRPHPETPRLSLKEGEGISGMRGRHLQYPPVFKTRFSLSCR